MTLLTTTLIIISVILTAINGNQTKTKSDANIENFPSFKRGGPSYEEKYNWPKMYPQCNGSQQSPINIVTSSSRMVPLFYRNNLDLSEYHKVIHKATITNNGHSVAITFNDHIIAISGGPMGRSTYHLRQCHFHFGNVNGQGSEHTIDGQAFDMEIHLIHKNDKYESMSDALNKTDGLLVIAILAKVDELYADPTCLNFVTRYLNRVQTPSSVESNEPIRFVDLLPIDEVEELSYWTYSGSLTTPKCNQVVTWVVSAYALPITNSQIEQFRKLLNFEGKPVAGNIRPTQPMKRRRIGYVNGDWI